MTDVTFYHHERADGGRRTGLTVNGHRAMERFVPGDEADRDPSLRWYVDVIGTTPGPLPTQEDAAEWFAAHADEVRSVLEDAADRLAAGMDVDGVPWSFERDGADGPWRVSVSAMRRYAAVDVADRIRRFLASDWDDFRRGLPVAGQGARVWPTGSSTPTS